MNQDLELAIQDMEDRASRLRDLIEQEEIMSEEYRRMSEESREHLLGARDQVASFLDEVHTSLVELERLRTTACLKAMTASSPSSTESQVEEVDYEAMLDALEEDLKVVHTVPLVQVKDALDRWVEAIKKEVQMLFQTGTLRRVTHGEIKELEQSGKVLMAPAKCVFTLKPPSISGRRARRKCRIVICGNYVPAGSSDISLYASGSLYGRSESGFGAVLVEQLARSGFGHCQCIFTGPVAQGLAPLRHPSTKGGEGQWGSNGLRILGH